MSTDFMKHATMEIFKTEMDVKAIVHPHLPMSITPVDNLVNGNKPMSVATQYDPWETTSCETVYVIREIKQTIK